MLFLDSGSCVGPQCSSRYILSVPRYVAVHVFFNFNHDRRPYHPAHLTAKAIKSKCSVHRLTYCLSNLSVLQLFLGYERTYHPHAHGRLSSFPLSVYPICSSPFSFPSPYHQTQKKILLTKCRNHILRKRKCRMRGRDTGASNR